MLTPEILAAGSALFWWVLLMISFTKDRSRYRNCYLLFFALVTSVWAVTFMAGDKQRENLYVIVLLTVIVILLVPAFLIYNGVIMWRNEGHSPANLLSLLFGIMLSIYILFNFLP